MSWEQTGNAITFRAFFTESKVGKTGLTVTVDVRDPSGTLIVADGIATETGGGLYRYTLASGSVTTEGEYTCIFKTSTGTVDQQHIPTLWVVGRAGVEHLDASINAVKAKTDNLPASPAAVGSAMTLASGAITTAAIADGALTAAKIAADALDGKGDWSTHAAADVWAVATRTLTAFAFEVTVAAASKSGYALASTGLDSIPITAPAGVATTFREMVVATWRRFYKQATKSSSQIKTYADDGTTVLTTQAISGSGSDESQGAAS